MSFTWPAWLDRAGPPAVRVAKEQSFPRTLLNRANPLTTSIADSPAVSHFSFDCAGPLPVRIPNNQSTYDSSLGRPDPLAAFVAPDEAVADRFLDSTRQSPVPVTDDKVAGICIGCTGKSEAQAS